jgi:hypothetical protein
MDRVGVYALPSPPVETNNSTIGMNPTDAAVDSATATATDHPTLCAICDYLKTNRLLPSLSLPTVSQSLNFFYTDGQAS